MSSFDFKDKNVLVTGGAGFIGSHLVDQLIDEKANVTVLDNLSTGYKKNLAQSQGQIEFVNGDVRNEKLMERLVEDKNLIFHLAANASVPESVENPRMDYEINSTGTFNILECCRKKKNEIENFVFASTAAVYGEPKYTPIDEDHPLNPISPYGASKLSAEKLGFAFNRTYELPFIALRIFNVYGPRQRKYVMYDFIKKLKSDPTSLEVLGSGGQKRSFCYVNDCVEGILMAAENSSSDVYNFSGESSLKIKELAEIMVSKISPGAEIEYTGESWEGDIQELIPDNSKIKKKLGFEENFSLNQGIEKLIKWFEDNEEETF